MASAWLGHLASGSADGELVLGANTKRGIYFGSEGLKGVHGSLARGNSEAVLRFCAPTATPGDMQVLEARRSESIASRCATEGAVVQAPLIYFPPWSISGSNSIVIKLLKKGPSAGRSR